MVISCCVARTGSDARISNSTASAGRPVRATSGGESHDDLEDEELNEDLEWSIVEDSISAAEYRKLQLLRQEVVDLDSHPACHSQPFSRQAQTLLRFLRGRNGKVGPAASMLRDYLDWRQEFRVEEKVRLWKEELDEGVTARSLVYEKYGTEVEMCEDKFGIPVVLMRPSVADPAGIVREVGQDAIVIVALARLERTHESLRRAMFRWRRVIPGQVQIIDMGDYGKYGVPNWWRRMWDGMQFGPAMYQVFDANYPETVRKVFIIRNGPWSYNLYRLVSHLIPKRTQKKMGFYGNRSKQWAGKLRDELHEDTTIPEFLVSDSESAFRTAHPRGGYVPEGFTIRNAARGKGADRESPRNDKAHIRTLLQSWPMFALVVALGGAAAAFSATCSDPQVLVQHA